MFNMTKEQLLKALDDREEGRQMSADIRLALKQFDESVESSQYRKDQEQQQAAKHRVDLEKEAKLVASFLAMGMTELQAKKAAEFSMSDRPGFEKFLSELRSSTPRR